MEFTSVGPYYSFQIHYSHHIFPQNPKFAHLRPGRPGSRHLTFHLGGGRDHDGTYYTLLRDGRILFIQNEPIANPDLINDEIPSVSKAANQVYNSFLTTIQLLLDQIEFDRGDWAYLLRDEDGSYRFVYRKKPLVMSKFIWAPFIDESEIEITRWGLAQSREGMAFLIVGVHVSRNFGRMVERKGGGCIRALPALWGIIL